MHKFGGDMYVCMAARATRSSSRKARLTEAVATGPLGALSHDELGVIFEGLADPLQPVVAVVLSSTCLGLRTPLLAALEVLKERHERAAALCRKLHRDWRPCSCEVLRAAEVIHWDHRGFTAADVATLAMMLHGCQLPMLRELHLAANSLRDAEVRMICEGLAHGSASSLKRLSLGSNKFGPAGAEALASALRGGSMPQLRELSITSTPLGNQSIAVLAPVLRKLPALRVLQLGHTDLGDEAVTSLVANLGKDDFKALEKLILRENQITNEGMFKLASALDAGGLPNLCAFGDHESQFEILDHNNLSGTSAIQAVQGALLKRAQEQLAAFRQALSACQAALRS